MLTPELKEQLPEGTIILDGLDEACLGLGVCCGYTDKLVYSGNKIIEVLMERDGMTEEEASEFLDFNIAGAYMGESTPVILTLGSEDLCQ